MRFSQCRQNRVPLSHKCLKLFVDPIQNVLFNDNAGCFLLRGNRFQLDGEIVNDVKCHFNFVRRIVHVVQVHQHVGVVNFDKPVRFGRNARKLRHHYTAAPLFNHVPQKLFSFFGVHVSLIILVFNKYGWFVFSSYYEISRRLDGGCVCNVCGRHQLVQHRLQHVLRTLPLKL